MRLKKSGVDYVLAIHVKKTQNLSFRGDSKST